MDKNLDILDSQDMALKEQLEKDAVAFQEEKLRPKPEQYTELLDARIQIRPTFREKLIEQLKGTFGEYYDYHYVISQPMKWMISIWKIPIASLIVPGNLNIRGNRNCKKNILFNPAKIAQHRTIMFKLLIIKNIPFSQNSYIASSQ